MNTVTGLNNISQRTHFDPSVFQVSTSKRQPPKSLAPAFVKRHIASLRENLAGLLNDHCAKHVTNHHFIW